MKLTNMLSGEEVRARALAVRQSKRGAEFGVAVELLNPSETFWGMTFRLSKAIAELQKIEQEIESGKINSRVLHEFSDSVDYVRTTAWAVQECQERQVQRRDTATVLPLLAAERVRRAVQLCAAIASDLQEGKLTAEVPGMGNLRRATAQLSKDLAELPDGER
jgi:HAMP domain-containing protein